MAGIPQQLHGVLVMPTTRAIIGHCKQEVEEAIKRGLIPAEYLLYENKQRGVKHVDMLCEGAVRGRDLESFSSIDEWLEWLGWSTVLLDEKDYLFATVHSLDLAPRLAATDYGTARQRDLGQLVTDTVRGFLGEIAFAKWLKERFNVRAELDFRKGPLQEFLPSDIKFINGRAPKLNVSIKTTKLRGIWLDIPFKQIGHSHIFVLVRIGATREHFLAFLKEISVIKDKILEKAAELGLITVEELESVWNAIPGFTRIPAYIAGFFDKRIYGDEVKKEDSIITAEGEVRGKKKVVVTKFMGYWHPGKQLYKERLIRILEEKHIKVPSGAEVEFEGVGEFSKTLHFIISSGLLKRRREDWERLLRDL